MADGIARGGRGGTIRAERTGPASAGSQVEVAGGAVMSNRLLIWLVVLCCCAFTLPSFAQVTGPSKPAVPPEEPSAKAGKPIRQEVEMALVNVTVTDPYNRLVTGLEKENFRVYEDGTEQEVVSFSSEDVPISIGLIFDSSGSMADKVDKERAAAIQFLKTANPRDEFFLVNFNDEAQLTSRFTTSVENLQNDML
jgi:Ca-activated chloride channel family protein